ncbi:hypothetical protein GCM10027290_54780 [Micromonospora sonneratiae]|jgi:hypothetical protein|uniref:DUF998 domain-containing protein n=1 Tax=Micromonospora sonneratiae TaxID=1184706 RepID=A0ABW3YRC3_9ACTN
MTDDRVRLWAWVGFAAQVLFVASWLLAAAWQGSSYSTLEHTISDMLAVGAPAAAILIVVFTLCGLATILFAWLSVRPALRPGGRAATVGAILLALSIFGLGDLLAAAERQGCRLADAGCTGPDQRANLGGKIDTMITPTGILLFVAAVLVLAAAMRRAPGWERWAWPFRGVGIGFAVLLFAFVGGPAGLTGLFERLLAAFGAAAIAALALGIARRPS